MSLIYTHSPNSARKTEHESWEEAKQHAREGTRVGRHKLAKRVYLDDAGKECVASWDPRHPGHESHNRTDSSRHWTIGL